MSARKKPARPKKQTLTEALKKAIEESGVSHYQIAKDAGISQALLSRFISGERPTITVATADRILAALDAAVTIKRKS